MIAKHFAQWVMNHRKLNIVLVLLATVLLGLGAKDAQFSANQRDSFQTDDQNLRNLVEIEEEFSSEKNIFILLEPEDGDIFGAESLRAIQAVTDLGWQVPYSQRVESVTNHLYTQVEGDDLYVEYLIDGDLSAEELEKRKAYALSKSGVSDYLVTREGDLSLVSIMLNLPLENSADAAIATVNHVKQSVQTLRDEFPTIHFRILGSVVMEVSMPEIVQKDSETVIPLATLIVFIFMALILRDVVGNIVAMLTCTLAVVAGLGAVLWTGVKLSPILMNTPAVIIILGMADCIHLIVNYSQGLSRGLDKKNALAHSIEVNFQPIVFTSLTTALSFLALNFSESPPFAHMGNAGAVGIVFAMIASLTFLPAMLYYLPSKAPGVASIPKLGGLVETYQRHGLKIVSVFAVIIVGLAALIPNNNLDDNFVEWFDEELQFRQDFDLLVERLGGAVVINISIPAEGEGGVLDPDYLVLLDDLQALLDQQPDLMFTTSLLEVMKTLNQNMHGDDPTWYRVPDNRALASQYLLMYEMSLPFGQGLDNLVNHDRSKSRVIAVFGKVTDKNLIALENTLQHWLDARNVTATPVVIGSSNIAFAHMQYANINKLSKGFILALVGISILLIFMFRSWSLGVVSIIPNLIPAVMAFGLWALISGKVGFGVSIGITVTLGIVVDDTIHFLSKYQFAKNRLRYSNVESVRYAMDNVGVAMMLTTSMMVIAFGAMLFSQFTPNQDIALITIITVFCAVFVDLILLPIVLLKLFDDKITPSTSPNNESSVGDNAVAT